MASGDRVRLWILKLCLKISFHLSLLNLKFRKGKETKIFVKTRLIINGNKTDWVFKSKLLAKVDTISVLNKRTRLLLYL